MELVSALGAHGRRAMYTSQPSTSVTGSLIRSIMAGTAEKPSHEELAALFAHDRIQHVTEEVFPHLLSGHIVVSDRYVHSSMAYQGAVDGVPAEVLRTLNRFAPQPDVTLILLPEKSVCLERIERRGKARDGYERMEAFEKAYEYYRSLRCGPSEFMLDASITINVLVRRARTIVENHQGRTLQSLKPQ
jgi:dTMP kinase